MVKIPNNFDFRLLLKLKLFIFLLFNGFVMEFFMTHSEQRFFIPSCIMPLTFSMHYNLFSIVLK